MLTKPNAGWTDVIINGTVIGPASYLTDVPLDCLTAMTYALSRRKNFCLTFDADGWDFKIIADNDMTYAIVCKDEITTQAFQMSKQELAKELVKDLLDNLKDWAEWLSYRDEDYEEYICRREEIKDRCKDIEALLKDR